MADKFNKNSSSDNINDFFAEFDKIVEKEKNPPPKRPTEGARTSNSRTQKNRGKSRGRLETASTTGGPQRGHKNSKKKKKPKSKFRRAVIILALLCLALMIAAGVYVGIVVANTASIGLKVDYDNIYTVLQQRSTIYDDKGKKIENIAIQGGNRTNVNYEDLPDNLKNAMIAVEDKTFWDHHGFNFIRMLGAVKTSVFGGGQVSGTSTISQQLARNIYLSATKSERSINRKIAEAYITTQIEKKLSKEQILEAYMNTIYLGFDAYGVEAASRAYFNKSIKKLNLLQCATLCSLPKSPVAFSPVKAYERGSISVKKSDILAKSDNMLYVYNGDYEQSKDRRALILRMMVEQNYITQAEADEALGQDLKKHMKVTIAKGSGFSSYFSDYALDQITKDIQEEMGFTKQEARELIYTGGLKIYTTMNKTMQKKVEHAFNQNYGYPAVVNLRRDGSGNILGNNGRVLLYAYNNFIGNKGRFTLKSNEFKTNSDGSLTLYAKKRLNFFDTKIGDINDLSVEFKPTYLHKNGHMYTIEKGTLSIPPEYKSKDSGGNCIVSAQFLEENPKFFKKKGGKLIVNKSNYVLNQKVIQPQSAMVIMDYKSGGIKAMVGGRSTKGKMLYNRATQPRQPGSSIKPISVYSSGLQASVDAYENNQGMSLDNSGGNNWGKYITAGSVINDAAMTYAGRVWPKNWYTGYRGKMRLRTAVEQSVNVCAVKTFLQMGPEFPTSQLKKMGVSTVVESTEAANDMNPAALALGGMTRGISPLEMAGAYGIFPNKGVYTEPITYTKITNQKGDTLFQKTPETEKVLDPGVAFIMQDILRSVVTRGLGKTAAIGSQPVAGKTGTTSDKLDIWFVGFTPKYTAALWIGNDVNIQLSSTSVAAAALWRFIMSQICAGTAYENFGGPPSNVVRINGEYYVRGTYSNVPNPSSSESSTSNEITTSPPRTTAPTTAPTSGTTESEFTTTIP